MRSDCTMKNNDQQFEEIKYKKHVYTKIMAIRKLTTMCLKVLTAFQNSFIKTPKKIKRPKNNINLMFKKLQITFNLFNQ